jgi:2-dehydropantoate 2-reductase
MTRDRKPVVIIGAGPVGSILAASFAKAGQEVLLVECAEARRAQVMEHGLIVTGKTNIEARVGVLASVEELKGRPVEAVFICTKTWSLKSILPALAEALAPDALAIAFQNGIGPEDEVARFLPVTRVARGIANYAGGINGERGEVTMHWFNPPNHLGPMDAASVPRLEELAGALTASGLETTAIALADTKKLVFLKTILNSALSALCAASGITMRQAMTYPHTRNLARMLLKEGLSVATAVGYTYGENAMEDCMAYLDRGGDHLPSMWFDLKQGNRTEIEYINGKIVKIASMFKNIDVGANLFFTAAIVTQELKTGVRKADEIPEYLVSF